MHMVLLASTVAARRERLKSLNGASYTLLLAQTSAEAWRAVLQQRPEAIVVDASAPDPELNPWLLSSELQMATQIPLILLVRPGRNRERLRAFRTGARQCLTVPVSPDELRAALDLILGERGSSPLQEERRTCPSYVDAWLKIDLETRHVCRGAETRLLTAKEWEVLRHLLEQPGRTIPCQTLYEAVWKAEDPQKRWQKLKTYVGRLRQKIEAEPKHPRYIISERGLGYSFVPQSSSNAHVLPEIEVRHG